MMTIVVEVICATRRKAQPETISDDQRGLSGAESFLGDVTYGGG
jgi:hypothetical protein